MRISISILLTCIFWVGCTEVNTDDPQESFKYWSGQKPSKDIHVINGKYWQSAHWSLEYKVYLEIAENKNWWRKFKKDNNLIIDSIEINENDFWEKPQWFNPPKKSIKYKENSDFDQGTRYFEGSISKKIFVYEIQL